MVRNPLSGVGALAGLLGVLALHGCFGSDGGGRLFGAPRDGGSNPGLGDDFQQGQAGGLVLRQLFGGARIGSGNPTVREVSPADGEADVPLRSLIYISFSESVTSSSASGGIRVFPVGSNTPVQGTTELFDGQTVVVFTPTDQLLPETSYELVVNGSVSDLQGQPLFTDGQAGEAAFSFTTGPANTDPPFRVVASNPVSNTTEVARSSDVVVLFSDTINGDLSGGGIFAPGNVIVRRGGAELERGTAGDYVLETIGGALNRGFVIRFLSIAAADIETEVEVSDQVESADGQRRLGNGFRVVFDTQDLSIAESYAFEGTQDLEDADGFVSLQNLEAFVTEVALTSDGQEPDRMFLVFFDEAAENALVFSLDEIARPTIATLDLQPQETEALGDGPILVAAYTERRTSRSEVSAIATLRKDTVGPGLSEVGPPSIDLPFIGSIVSTFTRDPVIYGRMDEPSAGVQIDFDGAGDPDFSSVQFQPGLSTGEDDFFVTSPSDDAPLSPQLEFRSSFVVIASDQFGNGAVGFDTVNVATVGMSGATIANPDGVSALVVAPTALNDFLPLGGASRPNGRFGMVVLEAFPPVEGGTQVVKGLAANLSRASFSDAELASIPTDRVTISIVVNDFQPLTYAGLSKPTSSDPRAWIPLIEPISGETRISLEPQLFGGEPGSATRVGAISDDLDSATVPFDRMVAFAGTPLSLLPNRLGLLAATEEAPAGSGSFRYASSEAYARSGQSGGTGTDLSRRLDFEGQTSYSAADPDLSLVVPFDNDDVVGDGLGARGPLGLLGSEVDQFRRLRLLASVPGSTFPLAVTEQLGSRFAGFGDAVDASRTATVLRPQPWTVNDSLDSTGFEDSTLEILLQPSLVGEGAAVDFDDRLAVELHVQDSTDPSDASDSSGYVRQRFSIREVGLIDEGRLVVRLPSVPTLTTTDLAHPPAFEWTEETGGNGVHRLTVEGDTQGGDRRRWRLFVAADAGGGPIALELPLLPTTFVDADPGGSTGTVVFEFGLPGTFDVFVDSFDFDPARGAAPFTFDLDALFQTDVEREHRKASGTDRTAPITTS